MKEMSMHILDIAQNSVRAKATQIIIDVNELKDNNLFEVIIEDNGKGIPEEILQEIKNPFTTSRTLRKVGLGIPLLDDTCRYCNGELKMRSEVGQGTTLIARMEYDHIDRPPLGDMTSTIVGLISSNEEINIHYRHRYNQNTFEFSTKEIKNELGDISLTEFKVLQWLKEYIAENLYELRKGDD